MDGKHSTEYLSVVGIPGDVMSQARFGIGCLVQATT